MIRFLGFLILLHDLEDFPKTDRFHHWMLGVVLMLAR